ncbi:hypothetical protein OIU85_027895 [Salix viminalis]|uniref:Uncharacterized protein n=1 Tax=Salix viminalis TaxID=40686 RepID=A0A9Q0QKA6_SALVM|nr:hypothetical protein OIU85_027895 [Salix viminalis]
MNLLLVPSLRKGYIRSSTSHVVMLSNSGAVSIHVIHGCWSGARISNERDLNLAPETSKRDIRTFLQHCYPDAISTQSNG